MKIEHILTLLILGIYLLMKHNSKVLSNKILGALLLCFGLRISKSILLYFSSDLDFMLITLGLTLILALGPLFYFYTKSYLQKDFKIKTKIVLHGLPFLIVLVLNSLSLLSREFYLSIGIYAIYLHFLTYIIMSFIWKKRYLRHTNSVTFIKRKWLNYIHTGILFIWASYFVFLLGEHIPYIVGPLTYSIAIYCLSLWAIKNKVLVEDEKKYQTSNLNSDASNEIFKKLETYFLKEKVFLDPNLKLQMVASKLNVTAHALSQSVNENYNQNFQYYLNSYRIKEAKQKLSSAEHKNVTISSVAYDCGFNSISAFNTAFKKIVNQTPSQFRNSANN